MTSPRSRLSPPVTRKTLNGIWCALLTPWNDDDTLDEARFAAEVRSYGGTGVNGVYTGGTTGEYYAQDDETFRRMTVVGCESAHAVGLPIQIGCTTLASRTARQRIQFAVEQGADAIQIAIPFWLQLNDQEVFNFFTDIAAAAGSVPLVLYHTGRSKRKLPPEMIGQLAKQFPTFIGMKDTGCDVANLKEMLQVAPELSIFSGEDDLLAKMAAGGRGAYCSVTGLNAQVVARMYQAAAKGDLATAQPLQLIVHRVLEEVLIPMNRVEGLWDSAIDRVQRVTGGGNCGLRCQRPYLSATPEHVERLRDWCRKNAPELLPSAVKK